MRRKYSALFLVAVLLALSLSGSAQTPSEDKAQIRAIVQSEADAWNRDDAEGFGAHDAGDGSFTNVIGQQLYGRKAFIAQHAMILSTIYKGSHNAFSISKLTFLRPDVALVEIDEALHVKLLELVCRENGSWSIQSSPHVAVYPVPPGGPAK